MAHHSQGALRALGKEFHDWNRLGAAPRLWWRDDDAHGDSPQLRRLCDLLAAEPLVLAVIPGLLKESLVRGLEAYSEIGVVQHGWKHVNYAPPDLWPSEYPGHRDRAEVTRELGEGQNILRRAFPTRFRPVLAPPWNTLAGWIYRHARSLGFCAVSRGKARHPLFGQGSTRELNAEVDICDWSHEGQFIGADRLAALLAASLKARREAAAWDEPIGINSHHMQIATDDFAVLRDFLALFREAGAVWAKPQTLFPDAAGP
jgi:hypothetical protein